MRPGPAAAQSVSVTDLHRKNVLWGELGAKLLPAKAKLEIRMAEGLIKEAGNFVRVLELILTRANFREFVTDSRSMPASGSGAGRWSRWTVPVPNHAVACPTNRARARCVGWSRLPHASGFGSYAIKRNYEQLVGSRSGACW